MRNGRKQFCEAAIHITLYKENTDNIIGVLNTKVYFRLMEKNREAVMAQAVEKPYFVPEIMKADVLFRNMKQEEKRLLWYWMNMAG